MTHVSEHPAHPAAAMISDQPPPPPPPATNPPLEYARPMFVEIQRITQWWVWALMLIPMALALFVVVLFLARPQLRGALLLPVALSVTVMAMTLTMRLGIAVTSQQVIARFFLLRRRIAISEIESFRAITYTLRDFGGWGIKWARDGSLVLNISGNRAIRLNRRSGKALILGTQRPDEFAAALEALGVPREPD